MMQLDLIRTVKILHCIVLMCRRIYVPYPFHWGRPTFDAGDSFTMMAASLVTLFEVPPF